MSRLFEPGSTHPLKEVLDKHFEGIAVDSYMAKALYNFQLRFINLTQDHLAFFSGNLLGVQVVHFTDKEVAWFFREVLSSKDGSSFVDYDALRSDILDVCEAINPSFKISSDTLNIVLMYIIHRFMADKKLPASIQHMGAYNAALVFFYRCVSALQSDWFTWPADPNVAQAAFANLDKKYLIKKLGTWSGVMEYRAKALLNTKESIHIKALERFNDDYAVVYAINDSQGRIRSLMKFYYVEFDKVHKNGSKISSTSQTGTDAEGNEVIKDKVKGVDSVLAVFKRVIADERSFVRNDLIQVIRSINKNSSVLSIETVLRWMSKAYLQPGTVELVDEFITKSLSYSYWLMTEKINSPNKRDYAFILTKLKNLYLSTRIDDPTIEEIRQLGDKIITHAFGDKKAHKSLVISTRTSIILYIALRSLTS